MTNIKHQAFTFWGQYLFLASFVSPNLKEESFLVTLIICFSWYTMVLYDFFKKGKLFNCMYLLYPDINKTHLHLSDILIHVCPLFISFHRLHYLSLIDVFYTWLYCRLWSFIQSNGKSIFYMKLNDPIYFTYCIYGWYIFYFVESLILFVAFGHILFVNNLKVF